MRALTFLQTLRLVIQYQRYWWIAPAIELEARLEQFFYEPQLTTTGSSGHIALPPTSQHSIHEQRELQRFMKSRRHSQE